MIARRLTIEDVAAWREIRLEALANAPTAFLTSIEEEKARPQAQTEAFLASGAVYGVFDRDRLAGTMAKVRETRDGTRHRAAINAVYIRPRWRGTAAGACLMATVVGDAKAEGIEQLELYVEATNLRAIRFYARFGFVETGNVPKALRRGGRDYDDLIMYLPLTGAG